MFLGIEIGGTKLQIGLGNGDGRLQGLWRGAVNVPLGADGIRRQILEALPELLDQAKVQQSRLQGVGVGFGGPVDDATRSVITSHQVPGWDGFPLVDWLGQSLGLPAVLGNDADVAALGEALFGAGKGLSPVFYMTIGSGIGGGLVIDGQIYRGTGRGAAEIGHVRLPGRAGRWQALEKLASGWGIREASLAVFGTEVPAPEVGERAAGGDQAALRLLDETWAYLAEALCHVVALLCPRRIVIGGGVSLLGEDLLFQPLRQAMRERVFPPFADCFEIVPAALGEEVVVHGALALARQTQAS